GGEGGVVLGPPTTQVEGPHHPLADRAAARVDEVDGSPVGPAAPEPAEDGGPLGLALQEGTRPPDAQNGGQARQRWGEAFGVGIGIGDPDPLDGEALTWHSLTK